MKSKVKVIIVILLSIIIFLFTFKEKKSYFENCTTINDNENINILMINSYHQGHYWEGYVLEGLKKELNKYKNYNIDLKVEYLDLRSKDSEKYIKSFKTLLESKYESRNIDVIYAVDDEAFELSKELQKDYNSVLYKIPMVITGVDKYISYNEEDKKYASRGSNSVDDTINLLRLILDLNKDVEKLNIIMDNSVYCKGMTKEILSYMDTMNKLANREIKINIVTGDYIDDIVNKLQNTNKNDNTVNILSGEFQYKDSEKFLKVKETVNIIKSISKDPIYSNDQTYLNSGILGGCVDLGQKHGERAAKLIMKLKDSSDKAEYIFETEPSSEIYVDYNGIYEYEIKTTDIDSRMNIINQKFYQLLIPQTTKQILIYIFILIFLISLLLLVREFKNFEKNRKIKEEERIRKLRENLKSDFIVNMSHELRTPINLILNSSKTIESRIDKDLNIENNLQKTKESIREKLNMINNNSYRLLKISNNIIDITKAESGLLKLEFENENIVEVVEEIFINSIEFAQRKNIEMVFDSTEEEIIIAIDKVQMQRVILNLISNAIKFTNNNGLIRINISTQNEEILIEVKDTGVGIREEYLEKIFESFYQVDYSLTRMNEGTGIGLSIVKDIVNIHNGRIEIDSKENVGTNFKIYIPINKLKEEKKEEKVININYDTKTMTNIELSDIT